MNPAQNETHGEKRRGDTVAINDHPQALCFPDSMTRHGQREAAEAFAGAHSLAQSADGNEVFAWAKSVCAFLDENYADETVRAISAHILPLIPDGATIQLGLGGVANAVGYGLREKNDLGIHSEMMSDSMMRLMQAGNVNNRRKTYMPGKSVAGFAFGSEELYRFLDRNEDMYFMPFRRVNDPAIIAQNDRMVSINTAMCVDLFGQVSSESLGFRQYSGVGGQLDFVRGAQNAREGKSFIAISSTQLSRSRGRISKIVLSFEPGTVVTTPRSDVQYVATEFGCVNLKPLSMKDRVRAMIGLAHPDFRDELGDRAREAGIL